MTAVFVRIGESEDVDAALTVWRDASTARRGGLAPPSQREDQVRAALRTTGAFLMVADEDGVTVGMALAVPGRADEGAGPLIPGLCFLAMVSVVPNCWGRRIGGQLVEAVIAEATLRGYDRAHLWTHAGNRRAQRLYEGHGFRRTGREMVDEHGESNLHYERAW